MAITEISYPVTGSVGSYKNIFPSQKPLYANFNRKDGTVATIVSGVDNNVRVAINETFENIEVGQSVVFFSDGYKLQNARIVSIIDTSTIELDIPFGSSDANNGFINYHKNWFLEVRYVEDNSASDNQDAIEILEDYSQIPSALNGGVKANIALPSDLISADFTITEEIQFNLFATYKIQYRESYELNRTNAWISPVTDIPILLVHSANDIEIGFTDKDLTKRFIKGYPFNYMYVYSNVNDAGNNNVKIFLNEYGIDKTLLASTEYTSVNNLNGVYNLLLNPNDFNTDTRFIDLTTQLITNNSQYDDNQYDPTQYA